jgi:hypothetical protein
VKTKAKTQTATIQKLNARQKRKESVKRLKNWHNSNKRKKRKRIRKKRQNPRRKILMLQAMNQKLQPNQN